MRFFRIQVWFYLSVFAGCCLAYILITQISSDKTTNSTVFSAQFSKNIFILSPSAASHVVIKSKSIKSLHELKTLNKSYFLGFGNGTIPRIVHITYKSTDLPIQYETLLRNCLNINPGVTFLFWTDSQADEYIRQQTKSSKNKDEQRLYDILSTYKGVEKADIFRLMVLYFIGGIYMDLDTECKISFTEIHRQLHQKMNDTRNENSCLIDQEQWLQTRVHWWKKYCAMNNFMICRPFHGFFQYILNNLKEDDKKTFIMDKTGPFLLTRRYEEYIDLSKRGNMTDKVTLAHPNWFSPLVKDVTHYEEQCKKLSNGNGWFKEGCEKDLPHYKKTVEEKKKNAFLIHRFLNLAYSYNQHLIKKHFSILSLSNVYVMSMA